MKVAVFDYGAGNLHSLAKALAGPGVDVVLETNPRRALEADALVLPGVGAFAPAAVRLAPALREVRAALSSGLPCLGICLGMQLLFDDSDEGPGEGLGVIPGRVTRLRATRVPHIGWNSLENAVDPLFAAAPLGVAYYANSFVCRPVTDESVVAWTTHEGDRFAAAVRRGRVVGVQFHPEKSSADGVGFVRAFVDSIRGVSGEWR